MGSLQMLNEYLNRYFPEIEICKPLFYNTPIGIRFEIGNPKFEIGDYTYTEQVYHRSIQLFKETHSNSDEIILVVNANRYSDSPSDLHRVKVFSKYVKDKNLLYKLNAVELPYIYDKDDKDFKTCRYVLKCRVADIRYASLLKAIGNQDMGIKPRVYEECFFINTIKHTIFHFYDDRGLDIVASKKEALQDLYVRYSDWILNYDRFIIDSIFRDFSTPNAELDKNSLIKSILNPNSQVNDVTDAVKNLVYFNDDEVTNFLLKVANDFSYQEIIRQHCGISLARIWLKKDDIDLELLRKLNDVAMSYALGVIGHLRRDRYERFLIVIKE